MKTKLFSVWCLIFFPAIICARQVKINEAQIVALQFLQNNQNLNQSAVQSHTPVFVEKIDRLFDTDTKLQIAFIAHLKPKGFIVMSCDTDIDPVIAYSYTTTWNPETSGENSLYYLLKNDKRLGRARYTLLPQNIIEKNNRKWQNLLNNSIAKLSTSFRQWPERGTTPTGGWLETTWTQHSPYNVFCPVDPQTQNRCVVGCVPTALSQIVHYHRSIGGLFFNSHDRYVTTTLSIHVDDDSAACDFPSFDRLNRYLDDVREKYAGNSECTDQDFAALAFACGIAVKTDFSTSGSGAHVDSVVFLLKERLNYSSAERITNLMNSEPTSEFYYALQENMMNAMPALLEIGVNAFYKLHAVVCDGYNTDGFYHLNFGWGSTAPDPVAEAWYLLPDGMPADYHTVIQAILDINPDADQQTPLSCDPDIVYLSAARMGETSSIESFSLKNETNTAVQIHYLVSSPPFLISTTTTNFADSIGPVELAAGAEATFYAQCAPDSVGPFDGSVIVHSSADKRYLNIHLGSFGAPKGGTVISRGDVSGVWDKSFSPYFICGDISVAEATRLDITPGVEIVFLDRFLVTVEQNARFIAKGALADSIYFHAANADVGWSGISFQSSASDDTLAYCVLSDGKGNPVEFDCGGAVSLFSSSPAILNSRLKNNSAFFGGAVYCDSSHPSIRFSTIEKNYAGESGGALFLQKSSPVVENTLFYNNQANTNGAFLRCTESSPTFVNITVADNVDGQYLGGFMYLDSDNYLTFHNSILWSANGDNLEIFMNQKSTVEFMYSNILTTYVNQHWPIVGFPYQENKIIWGSGNKSTLPMFTHAEPFKYVLQQDSPCIDAGDPSAIYNDSEDPDHSGTALWPAMGSLRNDMGAYGGGSAHFVVPVELAIFSAAVLENTVVLKWVTLSETTNYGFFVQRSTDSHTFSDIAFVKGSGTTSSSHTYTYQDENLPSGDYDYRLKQVDLNGDICFSKTVQASIGRPVDFSLWQNSPNPFNASTTIKYYSPCDCKILIEIYNLVGQKIKTLLEEEQSAGSHVLTWDATDDAGRAVSSGTYFLRMTSETFEKNIKLLLLR